jgi:hypothetical protein
VVNPAQDPDPGRRPSGRPWSDPSAPGRGRRGKPATAIITDAPSASSKEMSSRIRRYTITMAFRTACFVSMIFVQGSLRWVLLALAIVLPYVAVVAANQADQRAPRGSLERGAPADAPQLMSGEHPDVIAGDVVHEPHDGREGRVA